MIPLRPATLKERHQFYTSEFHPEKTQAFLPSEPQICALDTGSETNITKFPQYTGVMNFFIPKNIKKTAQTYLPESLYYDRNIYIDPIRALENLDFRLTSRNVLAQQLVYDVDANNTQCQCNAICFTCIEKAKHAAIAIIKSLHFEKVYLVYSGRGFHIHVFDEEAYYLTKTERKTLVKKLPYIDKSVSDGTLSLIRYPYSLNARVSRIVIPINYKFMINDRNSLPQFL